MSTRSAVIFKKNNKILCRMFRHWDGYPEGAGKDYAEFLKDFTIVNGLSANVPPKTANGFGCLIAQFIAHFKTEPGDYYIEAPDTSINDEEYLYYITSDKMEGIKISVFDVCDNTEIFSGTPSDLLKWLPSRKVDE